VLGTLQSGVPFPKDHTALKQSRSMLAMLVLGLSFATICWRGSVWLVPCGFALLCIGSLIVAVRRRSDWQMLKFGFCQTGIWLGLASLASALTVLGCLDYNKVAGTDKTQRHIIQISAAALAGPMVGPVANPAAGEMPQARRWAAILASVLFVVTSPFLFVRRRVSVAVACLCWAAFILGTILWFFGAMISLGVFLS
jgi:hypothetical protein